MSLIVPMCLFAFSMSVSPGPVNMVTFAQGLNYGFTRSLPFVAGAAIGFTLLLVVVGMGLGELIALNALVIKIMTIAGTAFICYMGYKIATAHPELPETSVDKPGFLHGAALQWLNPKAWIASMSGVTAFEATPGNGLFLFAGIYLVICFCSVAVWAFAGARISHLLREQAYLLWCNRIMGGLLILVAAYLFALHFLQN